MNKIIYLTNRIVEFGVNKNLNYQNKEQEIQKLLVEIYFEYLNVNVEFDTTDYKEPPTTDYNTIKNVLIQHFPDFSWYYSAWKSHEIGKDADVVTEDSIDDLTDIIKDLMEVKWRLENNSEKDGLYHFKFLMKNHSEQHLVNLLKYLKDKND